MLGSLWHLSALRGPGRGQSRGAAGCSGIQELFPTPCRWELRSGGAESWLCPSTPLPPLWLRKNLSTNFTAGLNNNSANLIAVPGAIGERRRAEQWQEGLTGGTGVPGTGGAWGGGHAPTPCPLCQIFLICFCNPKLGSQPSPRPYRLPLLGQVSPPASPLPLFPFPGVFSGRGFLAGALIPRLNTNHCRLQRGRKYFCSEYSTDPPLHGNGHYHYWWFSLSF